MPTQKIIGQVKAYIIITFGLFVHALSWTAFLIPAKLISGGVAGIAATIFYATTIPTGYSYLAINGVLILIAIKLLGANFGIKTIYSVVVISLFLNLQQKFITEPIITDIFMATVLGAVLSGVGIGIVFAQGGSTGGTDIIAMIVTKYRNMSPGKVILYCDIIIISSSYLVFQSIEKLVYGFVAVGVVGYTIDLVLNGLKQSVQLMIFSKKHNQIADEISTKVKRGVTLLNASGWYSKTDTKVVLTIVKRYEVQRVYSIVKEIDNEAFISQAAVMGTYGLGFDPLKG